MSVGESIFSIFNGCFVDPYEMVVVKQWWGWG